VTSEGGIVGLHGRIQNLLFEELPIRVGFYCLFHVSRKVCVEHVGDHNEGWDAAGSYNSLALLMLTVRVQVSEEVYELGLLKESCPEAFRVLGLRPENVSHDLFN
jgi:hypothetical protein